jgi:methyltransferase-like protein/SAM-dependent methyltransferase
MAGTSYDRIPYLSHPIACTHPSVLATAARFADLQAPDLKNARVLELGCGTGANLLPMADTFPEASFVGVDLSIRQIEMGAQLARRAGLANLQLIATSITEIDASFGTFDYIICHGVYSWVPREVRRSILEICRRNLSHAGLAYISYNTYPGWHMRGIVRDLLYFHARHFASPDEQIASARSLLDSLVEMVGNDKSNFANILRGERERLQDEDDHYLFHEHLEAFNEPCYFYQFLEQIAEHELQFVAEAMVGNLQVQVAGEALRTLASMATDALDLEQYLDFLVTRTFRRSVLCHAGVPVRRAPNPAVVERMYVTGVLRPLGADLDLRLGVAERFKTPPGGTITTGDAVLKSALTVLAEDWPTPMPFATLRDAAKSRLHEAGVDADALWQEKVDGTDPLAARLLQCYTLGTVELSCDRPRYTTKISDAPRTTRLARVQAEQDLPISNGRHRTARDLNDFDCLLLPQLDGTRDHHQLAEALTDRLRDGRLAIQSSDETPVDPQAVEEAIPELIEAALQRLARSALLVG